MVDVVLIHPNGTHGIYGPLGDELVSREQPLWPRLIAGYLLDHDVSVKIIDAEVDNLSPKRVADLVAGYDPRLACLVVSGHQPSASTQAMPGARAIAEELVTSKFPGKLIMMGNHPSALPEQTLREERVDYVIDGEGPTTIMGLLHEDPIETIPGLVWRDPRIWRNPHRTDSDIVQNPPAPLLDVNRDLHGRAWHLLPSPARYRSHSWQRLGDQSKRSPYAAIHTSLGCPFSCSFCVSADTPVNTIYGDIPIIELLGKEVPVFTFDPQTKSGLVATATNIRQYGTTKLVRVRFDDGTHIDCTPDHKFMLFNGKNKYWSREANTLSVGDRVVSYRVNRHGNYPAAAFSGAGRKHIHRLIAEWKIGRYLSDKEVIHHIDEDPCNWRPENLQILSHQGEHLKLHNMREQVIAYWSSVKRKDIPITSKLPAYQLAATVREADMRKRKGQKRWWTESDGTTYLSAQPRTESAVLGRNAGHWWTRLDGSTYQSVVARDETDRKGRIGFNVHKNFYNPNNINHRVISVEWLDGEHPVYCLDVPATGWFYANNVLIKNCMINVFQHTNRYRMRDPKAVVDEMRMLYHDHGVRTFKFTDELFVLNKKHTRAICEELIARGLGPNISSWCYARPDTVDAEELKMFRAAGFDWFALGIESGAESVRDGADKSMSQQDIKDVVNKIEKAGINVIANYIFGLPGETKETADKTLGLAMELNTAFANFYSAMAYPGSKLYDEAIAKGWRLPATWAGYSQHNEHTTPLAVGGLRSDEILAQRDGAFNTYFTSKRYLDSITQRFGQEAKAHIEKMTSYKLKRNLLEATQ